NHPNICTIHEIGTFDGQPFIAMEYVEGQGLADVIPSGGLPVDRVTRSGTQIAAALAHAHHAGVVHRDLKSANVMVTPDERIKVLDFGLAKQLRDEGPDAPRDLSLTATGMMMAPPNYLPPEGLLGRPADAGADVWSFGVVLYEMATGR